MKKSIFEENLSFLKESHFWSKEKTNDYQITKLKELINHCSKHVPYYKELFAKHKITSESIKKLEDIRKIPFLTKEIVKSRHGDFLANQNYQKKRQLFKKSTSGSTGIPLTIYYDEQTKQLDRSRTYFYMSLMGLNPVNFRSVRLRGDIIDKNLIKNNVFWFHENEKKLILSSFHFNNETVSEYVEKINEHKPDYIHCYPSTISLLAKYIEKQQLVLKTNIKCVFCDSERVFEEQRILIERVFKTKVFNVYGQIEGASQGNACPLSNKLHIMPQVGIMEIIDEEENSLSQPGQKGEIVVTGFYNKIFPLIRYRTSDVGVISNQACECGYPHLLLDHIEGRIREYLVDYYGKIKPIFSINKFTKQISHLNIYQFQLRQKKPGLIEFVYVEDPNDINSTRNTNDLEIIKSEIQKSIGKNFDIEFKMAKNINRTRNGKYIFLDQQLDVSKYFK